MTKWNAGDLKKIAETDDLYISPYRNDGVTYGTPTWIWSVVVADAVYVRAYNGQKSSWYQAALKQKAGRISAAGITKNVVFDPVKGELNQAIDAAYRIKYKGSPYVDAMVGSYAHLATVKIMPD